MNIHAITPKSGIRQLTVKQMFRRFDYQLWFDIQNRLTILTAPNGYGKTMILRIIHNFMIGNLRFFSNLSFRDIELTFFDDRAVRIAKRLDEQRTEENSDSPAPEIIFESLSGVEDSSEPYKLDFRASQRLYRYLERRLPIQRLGRDRWLDNRTDTVLDTDGVLSIYADILPDHIAKPANIPPWLSSLIDESQSHLIETQRLLSLELASAPRPSHRGISRKTGAVVEKDAMDLAELIAQTVNKYATEAQKLDQTFPRRVIERRAEFVDDEETVLQRLTALAKWRSELVEAGLIGESDGEQLTNTENLSDEDMRRILSIYIADSETKLSVFEELKGRVHLFKEILNERFLFKHIEVNQLDGITAYDKSSGVKIRLSELSSGEQHELVLAYELLFVVEDGAIILIDEPELSLHVAWQRRFISDIVKIQKLRNFQIIVATHSPQIISDHWDCVRELTYEE